MALIEGGSSGNIAEVGATGASPLHVVNKPTPYGSLGHYQVAVLTGEIAAGIAGASEILQFYWTSSTVLALIQEVSIISVHSVTGFTAGFGQLDLTIARSWTAAGTGGGTTTLTTNNAKMRTSMGTSALGELRVATTAALTAGTKTLDANRVGYARFQVDATANKILLGSAGASATSGNINQDYKLYSADLANGEHPLTLAANEGFVVRTTMPATGTWVAYFKIKWAEVPAF